MGQYHVGQVCLNGHPINRATDSNPEHNSKFCGDYGASTITECEACSAQMRGYYDVKSIVWVGSRWTPQSYCYECGIPYPWTKNALDTAAEFVDEADSLSDEEKEKLKSSLPDLTKDSPRTELAVSRYKKIVSKAGVYISDGLGNILISVLTEAAKRGLGL